MVKRTNRVASGLVGVLVVIVAAVLVAAHHFFEVTSIRLVGAGVRVTTTDLTITTVGEMPASDALKMMNGTPVYPWPGQTFYACGTGASRVTQIYREGDVVRAECHRITFFPWRRGWRPLRR